MFQRLILLESAIFVDDSEFLLWFNCGSGPIACRVSNHWTTLNSVSIFVVHFSICASGFTEFWCNFPCSCSFQQFVRLSFTIRTKFLLVIMSLILHQICRYSIFFFWSMTFQGWCMLFTWNSCDGNQFLDESLLFYSSILPKIGWQDHLCLLSLILVLSNWY